MKKSTLFTVGGALLSLLADLSPRAVAKSDIASPAVRAVSITNAEQLLQPRKFEKGVETAQAKNPFAPTVIAVDTKDKNKPLRPSSDQEFLALLAAQLTPTGVLMLGDQALLMFGEKKVKVGDSIKIPFDKETYEVELVDLSRTSFTVKLNNAEITRSIKPAK